MGNWRWLVAVLLLVLTAASCVAGPTLTIEAPQPGAEVSIPFTVNVSTSASLGPPDSGKPYLRIAVDGLEAGTANDTTFEITRDLAPGRHTIHVSLILPEDPQDALGPVGGGDEVTVVVTQRSN